ncbi:MAG: hypothetical protein WAN23_18575 [Candidatus Acidiferrales bacterium]
MRKVLARVLLALLVMAAFSAAASADSFGIGILSLDPTGIGAGATFDIQNLTGSADLPPDFPVATPLTFSSLDLLLTFGDGSTETLTTSDFTSDGFGGFTGNNIFDLGTVDITSAVLSGTLSPVDVTLADGTTETLDPTFTATLTDPSGGPLQAFDAVEIDATGTSGVTAAPESSSGLYLGIGVLGLLGMVWKRKQWLTSTNRALIEA